MKRYSRLWIILLIIMGVPLTTWGQEYENLNVFGAGGETPYYLNLEVEFQESDRNTRETGYYDVFQEKDNTEAKTSIGLGFLNLDGLYKDYHSKVTIGADETTLSASKSSFGARIDFLRYFYLFSNQKSLKHAYQFIDDAVVSYADDEAAQSSIHGLGMVFGLWRFGLALGASLDWSYQVGADTTEILSESLEFDVNVIEIIKRSEREKGTFFYELGLKNWTSSGTANARVATLSQLEAYGILGMGVSKSSDLYLGHKQTYGTISSILPSDGTNLIRKSKDSNTLIGFQIGIGKESVVYLERDISISRINLGNVISYGSENFHQELEYTFGYLFNQSISLELKVGQSTYDKAYYENVVNINTPYHYKQVDNYLGLSIQIQFSG